MLVNFSDLFLKSKGEPIQYGKKTLLLIDHFPVENEFQIMLKLISTNSDWKQAIQIAINSGSMTVDGVIKEKDFVFGRMICGKNQIKRLSFTEKQKISTYLFGILMKGIMVMVKK